MRKSPQGRFCCFGAVAPPLGPFGTQSNLLNPYFERDFGDASASNKGAVKKGFDVVTLCHECDLRGGFHAFKWILEERQRVPFERSETQECRASSAE